MTSPALAALWRSAVPALLWLALASPRPALGQNVYLSNQDLDSGTIYGYTINAADDVRVLSPEDVTFQGTGTITLGPGFSVANGARFHALIALPMVNDSLIFDDFRYVTGVGNYSDATRSGPANTIFGVNAWLGGDINALSSGGTTRAWYGFGWQDEYVRYPHLNRDDESLYDGVEAELYTEPVGQAPGHVVMQYRPATYQTKELIPILLTSGFSARTGTWVARVQLPDFEDFDGVNPGLGILLAPVWLKNSEEAWTTTPPWPTAGARTWWETNIEFWREPTGWRPYADDNAPPRPADSLRYLSAGNSWWLYSDALYSSSYPENATFGDCTVTYRSDPSSDTFQTVERAQDVCLDAMIGRAPTGDAFEGLGGDPYVYVMMQHTGGETRRAMFVRMEDESGNPLASTGFESLLLDQEQQNYVDAGFFSAQLEVLMFPKDTSLYATGTIGSQTIDTRFDWFLYTPDTDLEIEEVPDYARAVRQRLTGYNAGLSTNSQVWRVNTTDLELEAPRRAAPLNHWAQCNPWRITPTDDWDFAVEKTEGGGHTYFTPILLRDEDHDLRSMFQSVRWSITAGAAVVDTFRNEGLTLPWRAKWGTGPFEITATIVQTSPVLPIDSTYSDSTWVEGPDTVCPRFNPSESTRQHTYYYDPDTDTFEEVAPWFARTGEEGRGGDLPRALTLGQPYPNPSTSAFTFRVGLPQTGPVDLEVFDLLGRRVAVLMEEEREAGWHTVTLDGAALASGVYVYRLRADGEVRSGRITLTR